MAHTKFHYRVFVDHRQFLLLDDALPDEVGASRTEVWAKYYDYDWDETAFRQRLAVNRRLLAIGTERSLTVPLIVEVRNDEPRQDHGRWSYIIDAGIEISSGRLELIGCCGTPPEGDPAIIPLPAGDYAVRVYQGALDSAGPGGLSGRDRYRMVLRPGVIRPPHGGKALPAGT